MVNVQKVQALLAGIMFGIAPAVHAQATTPATQKFFVNFNVGEQLASRTINGSASQTIYEETAALTSTQGVKRGPLLDLGVGYRVWGDVFVGVIGSWYSDTEDSAWESSIPDPLFFNRPKKTSGTTADLKRTEVGTFVHGGWAFPLTDKLDIAAAVGIAIIKVEQDLVSGFTVATGTQNATTTSAREKATSKGPFAQVDVIYNLIPRLGVGGYVRYAGGKVDLTTVKDHGVGGVHVGGGVRLRF